MFRVRRHWWLIAGIGSIALLSAYFVNSNGEGATANGSSVRMGTSHFDVMGLALTPNGMITSGTAVMGISAHDGGLLRSEDSGKTWQALPNPNLYDLAMDPTDPSMIVGTTQTGLVRSRVNGPRMKKVG